MRQIRLPKLRASASFEPTTLNEASRSVKLTWYSGASVLRVPFFDEPFKLRFSMDPKAVRLERLNRGAPLLDSHDDVKLSGILGVVESAWIADGKGRARVRFSEREEVEPIFRDVRAGIIKNVSMGARVHTLEEQPRKKGEIREFLATDWEPAEISLLAVPADAGAQTLNDGDTFVCRLTEGGMSTTETTEDGGDELERELTPAETKAQLKELKRRDRIREVCTFYECGDVLAQKLIADGATIDEAKYAATKDRADRAPRIDGNLYSMESWDRGPQKLARMAGGMAARQLGREPTDGERQFYNYRLADAARELLTQAGGFILPGMSDRAVLERLMHTRSDFPLLVGDYAHKLLVPAYEQAKPTFMMVAQRRDVPDYRPTRMLKVGDFPVPLLVNEAAEIQHGTLSESGENATALRYGRILSFSRELLVNDDQGAIPRVMGEYGRRIADLQNAIFFSLLTSASGLGPTLSDGVAFFNAASHGNYVSSGTAIDVTSIGVGVSTMRKQTSLDGLKLNVAPRFLLSSPDKETLARQYTAQINPNAASSVNPFGGIIEPLADANLTTANPWYLIADPSVMPGFVYGSLVDEPGPRVATRPGFETEGVEIRVAFDFFSAALEHRAWFRNAGA